MAIDAYPENGYYTWARYGFDGKLSPGMKKTAARNGFNAVFVRDLMETPEGRTFWKREGESTKMTFNLTETSRHSVSFKNYLSEKGKS